MAQQNRKAKGGGSSTKPFYTLLAVVAVVGVVALAWVLMGGRAGTATEPVALDFETSDVQLLLERAQGVDQGPADAPVRVIEFADYQCPACAVFATQMKPAVKSQFIDQGQVRFTFFDYPIISAHPHAFLAARAARCAGDQDRYWDYHDVLMARQSTWAARQNAVGDFLGYASDLGLDDDAFESCLKSDRHAEAVTASARLGEMMGVSATPTVIVNGQTVQDWRYLPQIIEQQLGGEPIR
ncbi:MAG TPA: thioredoxin domain-containing protein [Longimicrobiales bacterium]|nr:thioredoxin domain-containing protein [Longimicrobiales bacterium]